jgi:hypothetical protein
MMWVKLDCTLATHRKMLRAGAEASWLWVCGLAYANQHTTNGVVPREALTALYPSDDWTPAKRRRLAEKLVEVGLWEAVSDQSWEIHGYAEHQGEAMSDAVEARREREREKKRAQRDREKTSGSRPPSHKVSPRDTEGTRGDMSPVMSPPVPGVSPPSVPTDRPTDSQDTNTLSPAAVAPLALAAQATPDLDAPKRAKKPVKKPAADPPPFSVADALDALASTAGRRFVVGDKATWAGGWVIALQKLARQFPDLSDWRLVGAWLAAGFGGGLPTAAFGVRWAASGALPDAVAKARAWDADGRPAAFDERGFPVRATVEAPDPWAAAMRKAGVQ